MAAERDTPGDLFVRLAIPLAAIGPVGQFLHGQLFGYGAFGVSYTPSLVTGIATAGYYYLEPGLPSADTIRDVKLQTPLRCRQPENSMRTGRGR